MGEHNIHGRCYTQGCYEKEDADKNDPDEPPPLDGALYLEAALADTLQTRPWAVRLPLPPRQRYEQARNEATRRFCTA